MILNEGIYSMFFVSTLHPEYVYYFMNVQNTSLEVIPDGAEMDAFAEKQRD